MKVGNVLLAIAAVGGIYYLSQLGIATNTISIIFQGVQIKSVTQFVVVMRVQNVSNVGVKVNSMTGTLSLFSNQIADLSDFTEIDVPPNGQVDVPVTVNIDLLSLPSTVSALLSQSYSNLDFNIQGNANVSGLVIPFDMDKTVSIGA